MSTRAASIEQTPPDLRRRVALGTNGCWQWTGSVHPNTCYGRVFGPDGGQAHRLVYEQLIGSIPEGLVIDHLCRNRSCVNPAHLEVVTSRVNTLRGFGVSATNARKTHCLYGHELEGQNLRVYKGKRVCRACDARRQRLSKQGRLDVIEPQS